MNSGKIIKVRVSRFNPALDQKQPEFRTYEVPITEAVSVLNVLQYINEQYDGGLAFYVSCRRGLCAGCAVRVNGKPKLACTELVTGDLTIEPLSQHRVLKDLLLKNSFEQEEPPEGSKGQKAEDQG